MLRVLFGAAVSGCDVNADTPDGSHPDMIRSVVGVECLVWCRIGHIGVGSHFPSITYLPRATGKCTDLLDLVLSSPHIRLVQPLRCHITISVTTHQPPHAERASDDVEAASPSSFVVLPSH